MDLSVIQSAETASTKAAVTVGVNVHITSGKETGIINAPWNVCEVKSHPRCLLDICLFENLEYL